jgi:hypothetical protein
MKHKNAIFKPDKVFGEKAKTLLEERLHASLRCSTRVGYFNTLANHPLSPGLRRGRRGPVQASREVGAG